MNSKLANAACVAVLAFVGYYAISEYRSYRANAAYTAYRQERAKCQDALTNKNGPVAIACVQKGFSSVDETKKAFGVQ